jgi:hypothetical protein
MTDLLWRRVGGLGVIEIAYRVAINRNIFFENTSAVDVGGNLHLADI